LFLFVLAVAGGVVMGDLVWDNPKGAEVTVFDQPVTGSSQGWLLAGTAAVGLCRCSVAGGLGGGDQEAPGASPATPQAAA